MGSINGLDIAIAAVVLLSAVIAYARGFVQSLLFVAAWVGAIFAAVYALEIPAVRAFAEDYVPVQWSAIAAGSAIFLVTLIVLSMLSTAIGPLVQGSALNVVDRSLGFLFGIVRGVVLICLVYIGVEWMIPEDRQPRWVRSARSIPLIEAGVGLMKSLVPGETTARGTGAVRNGGEEVQKLLESETRKSFNRILSPEPKGAVAAPRDGYNDQERREIDRLIDSNQ